MIADFKSLIAIVLIAVAWYYSEYWVPRKGTGSNVEHTGRADIVATPESQIANAWGTIIKMGAAAPTFKKKSRIAVGVNVNADLIVSGTAVLRKLGLNPTGGAVDHSVISSLKDFEENFAFSFKNGAAVERIFDSGEEFERVLQAADSLEEKQYFVGGNAALAGLKMATSFQNLQVLLIGPCGPQVRALLPENVLVPDTSVMATDEVHLIMEFKREEMWGNYQTKVATRFITSYDVSNSEMTALSRFSSSIKEYSPDAVFFAGLHLLDGQPGEKKGERLVAVRAQLQELPPAMPLHLELASMADTGLMQGIFTQILSSVHSLGLNEQELSFMSATNTGPHTELFISEGCPEVGAVADILHWILTSQHRASPEQSPSKLTRVHFHSLAFHIVATIRGTWTNSAAAVAAGARVAGRQACDDGKIIDEKVELRMTKPFALSINYPPLRQKIVSIDPKDPVIVWTRDDIDFHFTPVLVCKNPVKTVGLGDAISSTGFLLSQIVPSS